MSHHGAPPSRSLTDLQLLVELLYTRIERLHAGLAVGVVEARSIANAWSVRFHRRYTLSRVGRAWGFSRSTLYRSKQAQVSRNPPKPCSLISDSELVSKLRQLIWDSPFPAERHRKLWAKLHRQGIHVSRERVRRIVREHELFPKHGAGIITPRPDITWGLDSTKVRTSEEGEHFVLVVIDHCADECMAVGVTREETSDGWVFLIYKAMQRAFGSVRRNTAKGLTLRCDNHPVFREAGFSQAMGRLGARLSRAPILYPQANGCAERFNRTLKENLLGCTRFCGSMDLLSGLQRFMVQYNEQWLIARLGYQTPNEIRQLHAPQSKTATQANRFNS